MVETGYRYSELHWARRDLNWGYAPYQLGKVRVAPPTVRLSPVAPGARSPTDPEHP